MTEKEQLPNLDDFLGVDDKAAIDASRIRAMALSNRQLDRMQEQEQAAGDSPIPNMAPEDDGLYEKNGNKYRTFDQQRALTRQAFEILWDQIERDGYRATVIAKLDQMRQG